MIKIAAFVFAATLFAVAATNATRTTLGSGVAYSYCRSNTACNQTENLCCAAITNNNAT